MTTYNTMEAIIKEGKIYPLEPEKLPAEGKILLIVIDEKNAQPDPEKICSLLGWLKSDVDSVQWQRQVRAEWTGRH